MFRWIWIILVIIMLILSGAYEPSKHSVHMKGTYYLSLVLITKKKSTLILTHFYASNSDRIKDKSSLHNLSLSFRSLSTIRVFRGRTKFAFMHVESKIALKW